MSGNRQDGFADWPTQAKNTVSDWQTQAKRRIAVASRAFVNIPEGARWWRLGNDQMRLKYLDNIERCYAEDPVAFAHFEPLVMELITAKLTST